MKKIIVLLLILMPVVASAQSTLTPQEQLEQAQKQLEEAQKALDAAKVNAAKAKAEAEAKAKEAARIKAEAAKAKAEAKAEADAKAKAKAEEIQRKIAELKRQTQALEQQAKEVKASAQETYDNAKAVEETAPIEEVETPETEANDVDAPAEEVQPEKKIVTRVGDIDDDDDNNSRDVYLAKGAVPLVNGKVVWATTVKVPGKSAAELYDITDKYLTALTSDKLQLPGSGVPLKNPKKHNLTATVHEWLVFRNSALSLDRTEFFYVLNATCSKGKVVMTMSRLKYTYDVQGDVSKFTAEEWITDKQAVNKKRTRLYPISGKFRRKTIDRKNEIFKTFRQTLLQ